jgi:hypothetical protein
MPNLYITEFTTEAVDSLGRIMPVAKMPAIAEQVVVFTASSGQSATLNDNTTLVRLQADGNCSVAVGVNPTAATSNMRLVAGQAEYFGFQPNSGLKIAAITNT